MVVGAVVKCVSLDQWLVQLKIRPTMELFHWEDGNWTMLFVWKNSPGWLWVLFRQRTKNAWYRVDQFWYWWKFKLSFCEYDGKFCYSTAWTTSSFLRNSCQTLEGSCIQQSTSEQLPVFRSDYKSENRCPQHVQNEPGEMSDAVTGLVAEEQTQSVPAQVTQTRWMSYWIHLLAKSISFSKQTWWNVWCSNWPCWRPNAICSCSSEHRFCELAFRRCCEKY